ncbi:MAG: 4Fe-4S dicluster domain-containing protein [candidate division KSB1 bacterium]|nr:4Fe-4S dicluster domain-containing protein [candidate division KSB1 bacterium]
MTLIEQVKQAGVVGAGGAGFPTHVKLAAKVEWYLANGAECEPLMHKDRELMTHFAPQILKGLQLAAAQTGAVKTAVGVKKKNAAAVEALKQTTDGRPQIVLFEDYYPAGDEYELVYTCTGRLIPPQGLPLDVGCVVNNVETLYQIAMAAEGKPVTDKFMTVTGLVKRPLTAWFPIGMPVKEVLAAAGGVTQTPFAVMESGLMMGRLMQDLEQPITKTTGGLIVLPEEHPLIQRYRRTPREMDRIGHSACDQCSYCTELCPRYLLGYDVQPHLVMRSLGFTALGKEIWNRHALLCCQCGLCTLYACPEMLYPREACVKGMNELRAVGKGKWDGFKSVKPHLTKEARRVPVKLLMQRLGVSRYEAEAHFEPLELRPKRVVLPLKQHVGVPAEPVVQPGERVRRGQFVARIPEEKLGANLHASIDGKIIAVTNHEIVIEA